MKNLVKDPVHSVVLIALALLAPSAGLADTVIGNWQTSSSDGWVNSLSANTPITDGSLASIYSFAGGAVSGYSQSLQINQGGFGGSLAIKLQDNGYLDDFLDNHLLSFTFSVDAASVSGSTAGYSQVYALTLNAQGFGYSNLGEGGTWPNTVAIGDTGNNSGGGQPNYYFYGGAPARSQTVTVDYSSALSTISATPGSGWIELMFTFNNGGGAPANIYMNEVVLSGGPAVVPEPSAIALAGVGLAGLLVLGRRRKL
jgi:hypothetical protein